MYKFKINYTRQFLNYKIVSKSVHTPPHSYRKQLLIPQSPFTLPNNLLECYLIDNLFD